jgi:uncharacterized membrane protein YkvA (DUF1232 family)
MRSATLVPESFVTIDLNPREKRLYDRLRSAVSGLDSAAVSGPDTSAGSGFRDVVLLLPDLTVLLARLLRDRRVPVGSKLIALAGVGYVLSPVDLLPVFLFGPLGWVDDLLVVAAALSRVLNGVHPDIVRSHWPGTGDALDAIQRVSSWSNGVVEGGLRRILKRTRS